MGEKPIAAGSNVSCGAVIWPCIVRYVYGWFGLLAKYNGTTDLYSPTESETVSIEMGFV